MVDGKYHVKDLSNLGRDLKNAVIVDDKPRSNILQPEHDLEEDATKQSDAVRKEFKAQCNRELLEGKATRASSTNSFNTVSTPVNTASTPRTSNDAGPSFVPLGSFPLNVNNFPDDPLMPDLEDTAAADFNNMEPSTVVSPIPTTRVHFIHPKDQIIRDPKSTIQTWVMSKKNSREHAMISYIQKQKEDGIFISQDKYIGEILKKFGFSSVRTTSTPMETNKALTKDEDDSDYVGASLDKKSTTGGCQFLGSRLISWQCKKQTVVANSTTKAEYIAASHCCGQVLWIQN
ncbi:uncharacterized mitochondrial protein-like protein [Tanacetum coccineum]